MIAATKHTNDVLIVSVDNASTCNTRHAGFSLNQSKLLKSLRQYSERVYFDMVINSFDENINVKCSIGFFHEVASPALLSLANI